MTSTHPIIFLNGKFIKADEARISIFDHGFLYGDGVYETLRTYGGKVWQLSEHVKRLQRSACYVGLELPFSLKELADLVVKTVSFNNFGESRIRITLTRGANGYDFMTCRNPTLCIQVQELRPEPSDVYRKGVDVVTFCGGRDVPQAKTISLLPMILANRFMRSRKAYEALFVAGKGPGANVLEGTITNVFVVKKGILMTPKAGMLPGTTRQFLLKIAKKNRLKVAEKFLRVRDLYEADEIFITNAPRGIVPVKKIDGRRVGTGRPGPVTQSLMKFFESGSVA